MANINFKTHMTMKQQSFLLRFVVLVAAVMCAIGASAYTFQSGGIYYNVTSSSSKTVEVTYMDATYYSLGAYDGSITIPSTVTYNGYIYTVTRIGDRAFYNADGLTSLTIPGTVLSIGELAFCWQEDHYCNRLTSITIPNSVKTIANEAFRKCYALQTVIIGDGVTSIGESAFSKCIGLTSVTIGSSVTSIGANAFWGAGYDPDVSSSNPTGLTITSKAVNPPTIQSATFPSKTYSYATLKVPSGSKTAYQSANYWRNFSYIQEFYTLDQALNVSGGTITFLSEGNYPWITMQGSGRVYAQSGNAGVSSSTSEMTATLSVAKTSTLSFDFKAWGEGSSYDVCRFLIDGVEQFKYGARDNDWETYSVDLAACNHTLTWSYSKDGSVNPTGDYFAVDNVAITAKPEAYACYTLSNKTLTFYFDTQRSSRSGITYDLNTGNNYPDWCTDTYFTRVVFDSSFANARPTTTAYWFSSRSSLQTITGIEYLNTSNVTNMSYMFKQCSSLTSLDLSRFNTSNVTNMSYMFIGCSSLTSLNVSSFNTSNVTNMSNMFNGCSSLTSLNVSSFNTSKVTDMKEMFYDCRFLTSLDLSNFNTSKVTDMSSMFSRCYRLTSLDMSNWNTSNVTIMRSMFSESSDLTSLDLSNFNTSNVTDMGSMFSRCTGLTNLDLSNFNTSNVTDMGLMFYECRGLTSFDLSNFNTSNVTDMRSMFSRCTGLTSLNVSNFNTSKVTNMSGIFYNCSGLTSLDLSVFNTSNVTDMSYMFYACTDLQIVYVGNDWSTAAVTQSSNMFDSCTRLVGGKGTAYSSTNPMDKTYAHIDGGPSNPGYFTDKNAPVAYACYTPSNTTLTFYYDNQRSSRTGTTYNLNTGANDPGWWGYNVTQVVFDPSFVNARPTSTFAWFAEMLNLESITGMSYLNTSEVTEMAWMFYGCSGLTSLDLSHFNTSKVTSMDIMFHDCSNLINLDLSSFNTSNVTDMSNMFSYCQSLRAIYVGSGWSTAAVATSNNMFNNCASLVGGKGTAYSSTNPKDKTYAHIDGGPSNPGYFTDKNAGQRGDVNGDGNVTISDVTALIDLLLGGGTINNPAADCNGDSNVTISDVTALIDFLLGGTW